MPSVSILLPVHNAATTLPACLASIADQTLDDYELIAVDDGSGDGSAALLRRAAESDRRVRLLSPGRIGLVAALAHGLAAAQAPLVARMDADDLMHPERLQRQVALFDADPGLDLVACQVALFADTPIQAGYREYVRWQNLCLSAADIAEQIYVESPFAHPSVMFRRETVLRLGGYRDGPFPEDYDLWLRMHAAGCRMVKLPRVLLHWREWPQRTSRTDPRCAREAFDRLRADYLARDPRLHGPRGMAIWGAGRRTRQRARHLLDRGVRPLAWIDIDPRKIGNIVWDVPVRPERWLDQPLPPFVLVYVASHGAREEIGGKLARFGYRRGRDYLCVG